MRPKLPKFTKQQWLHFLRYAMLVVVGNAITAAGATLFIIPNGFVMGGSTGIGIFVSNMLKRYGSVSEEWLPWVENITVYVVNIILFAVGVIFLGKKFAGATLAGTILYPAFMTVYNLLYSYLEQLNGGPILGESERMLGAIAGALLFGLGIALVVRVGASTGGTDIPPLILKKYFDTPISVSIWVIDTVIICLQFIAGETFGTVLYGILITLLSSVVIDVVSPIGLRKTQVKIISKNYRAIRDLILKKLNRGVTVLYGQTGYLKEKCYVLLTIVGNRELHKLKSEVQKIDPEAFMMVSVVSEVRGRGFTSEGIALPSEAEGKDDLSEVDPASLPEERAKS